MQTVKTTVSGSQRFVSPELPLWLQLCLIWLTFDLMTVNHRLCRGAHCWTEVELSVSLLPPKSTTEVKGHCGFRSICNRCDQCVIQVWGIKLSWSLWRWSVIIHTHTHTHTHTQLTGVNRVNGASQEVSRPPIIQGRSQDNVLDKRVKQPSTCS